MRRFLVPALYATLALLAVNSPAAAGRWVDDAVVYGVISQLFGPRGLADVTARLDEIAALGVTTLWLSPITDAPPGDFGYAVTDQSKIRRSIGSEADLHALVDGAHARHLRVILDIAANDLSDQHPFYKDVERQGTASPYYSYFARDDHGAVTHYFDWTGLENLNYDNPAVQAYMIGVFAHWLREFDVDGFRVDAAWGPRQRTPGFWPRWATEMRRIKADVLLLAEASERDPYYAAAGFDAAYDWTEQPGEWAWRNDFAESPARHLRATLASEGDAAPIFRFLDNNDSGARFITRHGVGSTRVGLAMLMTLPGLPCLYMGEEVGAEFEPYAARASIDWSDPHHLRDYVKHLLALRHAEPALRSRNMSLVETDHGDDVLAYLRSPEASGRPILVLLNYGGSAVRVAFPHPEQLGTLLGSGIEDVLNDERMVLDSQRPELVLAPLTARVLRRIEAH